MSPSFIKVFGDDSVFATFVPIDCFDLARVIHSMGMEINTRKTILTNHIEEVEFLGFRIAGGFP